jgi:hypothetical protein
MTDLTKEVEDEEDETNSQLAVASYFYLFHGEGRSIARGISKTNCKFLCMPNRQFENLP